jgi:hypothetical protein
MVKTLAKIIIGLLSLWAIVFIIAEIMGVTIYFPFTIVERQELPYHRITSVRLAVFLTFIQVEIKRKMEVNKELVMQ